MWHEVDVYTHSVLLYMLNIQLVSTPCDEEDAQNLGAGPKKKGAGKGGGKKDTFKQDGVLRYYIWRSTSWVELQRVNKHTALYTDYHRRYQA